MTRDSIRGLVRPLPPRPGRGRGGPTDPESARNERRARSVEEPLDVRLVRSSVFPDLEVRNPLHGTSYRVFLPEFPAASSALCTCTDFARRDLGTCKHIEAAWRYLTDRPGTPAVRPRDREPIRTAAVWREIARRQAAEPPRPGSPARRWRWVGAVLFETGSDPG